MLDRYRREMRAIRESLLAGGNVVRTSFGAIEYATFGDGRPVLVMHGSGGGYDQGIMSGRLLLGDDFRLIRPVALWLS